MKVFCNTCGKELSGEMNSAYENYFKRSLENFQKSLPREICVNCLEKNSVQVWFMAMLRTFHY